MARGFLTVTFSRACCRVTRRASASTRWAGPHVTVRLVRVPPCRSSNLREARLRRSLFPSATSPSGRKAAMRVWARVDKASRGERATSTGRGGSAACSSWSTSGGGGGRLALRGGGGHALHDGRGDGCAEVVGQDKKVL